MLNIYFVYEIKFWPHKYYDDPTLENYLLGAVKLVKNPVIDKYKYSGYGIGFETHASILLIDGIGFVKNNSWC